MRTYHPVYSTSSVIKPVFCMTPYDPINFRLAFAKAVMHSNRWQCLLPASSHFLQRSSKNFQVFSLVYYFFFALTLCASLPCFSPVYIVPNLLKLCILKYGRYYLSLQESGIGFFGLEEWLIKLNLHEKF